MRIYQNLDEYDIEVDKGFFWPTVDKGLEAYV